MNVLVFDIETVPDVENGRKLYDLAGLNDEETALAMMQLRRQETGRDMMRYHLQKIVAISVVFRSESDFKIWTLGEEQATEKDIIERFFAGVARYTPTLVSWNGSGFDLPVLHYRAMLHSIQAPNYWETGDQDQRFRWSNYISRYHFRHTDVMDILALYQPKAYVPLDQMATLLGFPGKLGMDGSKVWDTYQTGDIRAIRQYCETDVLNTYLVYLRFQLMRGQLDKVAHEAEINTVLGFLEGHQDQTHWQQFLDKWQGSSHAPSPAKEETLI